VLRAVANGDEYLEEQGGVVLRREQVKAILFDGKMEPPEDESIIVEQDFLGSLSIILGKELPGDMHLPDWIEQGVDPTLRDTEEDNVPPLPAHTPRAIQNIAVPSRGGSPVILTPGGIVSPASSFVQRGKWIDLDLDKFYDDEEGEETDGDDDEEESDNDDGDQTIQGVGGQGSTPHIDSSTADSEYENEDGDDRDNDDGPHDSHYRQLHTKQ